MLPLLICCAMYHESDLFDVIKRANEAYVKDREEQEKLQENESLDEYMEND